MNGVFLADSIFSPTQVGIMVAVGIVVGLLIIANIALFVVFRRRRERKLCTAQLQQKRDMLLSKLKNIKDDGSLDESVLPFARRAADAVEGDDETDDEADIDEADDDSDSDDDAAKEVTQEEGDISAADIFAVADMSEYTRRKLGCVGDEYDRKRYYVMYKQGFEAKLTAADDEVKQRYQEIITELWQYKGVKLKSSFRQQRIYRGRKTLGIILFRGKTLCLALALDPKPYEETKYRGIDKSDKKRFAKTPMLYRLTSARKAENAKYLILRLAEENTIPIDENAAVPVCDFTKTTPDEMFVAGMIRIVILGEAPEAEPEPEPELTVEETFDGVPQESDADREKDEGDDDIEFDTPEGRMVFDRSFAARIIQADDALKARYSELKNYLLNYKGVKNRVSWKRETFSIGRTTVATFNVRGKTLCLYLAADPTRFDNTKYHVDNMSETASRRKTPLLFKVRSDRRTAYAKQLIDIVMQDHGAVKTERRPVDYTSPYRSNDALVKRGLIRITQSVAKNPFAANSKEKNIRK